MDLLLPLSLFRVRYETASGRPYSELDKLVLSAIAEGANSLTALQKIFLIRGRILIEVLITLARAGWVAIDVANGGFRITAAGMETLGMERVPQFTVIGHSEATMVMETLTGGLVAQQEMKPYVSNRIIEKEGTWKNTRRLRSEFSQIRLDPGQVSDLLQRTPGEWIRWIDVPELASRDFHFLPISVDVETGVIHNLPDRWRRGLGPLLLARARELEGSRSRAPLVALSGEKLEWEGPRKHLDIITEEDVLLSRAEHFGVLKSALTQAQSTLFVASAFFDTSEVDSEVRDLILAALKRGVQIYFFWGYAIKDGVLGSESALAWLRQLRRDAAGHGNRLRFNQQPTDSHAKFLVFDRNGKFEAFVGSCNWLSTCLSLKDDARVPMEATVRLRHPSIIASICRSAAGFWVLSRRGVFADAPELLRRAAQDLDSEASLVEDMETPAQAQASNALVRIVRDQEHESLMRELLLQAKQRCLIVSHKLGAKALIRLASLRGNADPCKNVVVQYGRTTTTAPSLSDVEASLRSVKASLSAVPSRHSKILVVDQTALVSSYNFLSADPFGNFGNAREIGVLVEGGHLPDILWRAHVSSGVTAERFEPRNGDGSE